MHEEGDHATKNQLSGSLLQGDGLEKRLEQWECILHDQHGRLLLQRLANGPLPHHYFAQIRRKEEAPPFEPTHIEKAQLQNWSDRVQSHPPQPGRPPCSTQPCSWPRRRGFATSMPIRGQSLASGSPGRPCCRRSARPNR